MISVEEKIVEGTIFNEYWNDAHIIDIYNDIFSDNQEKRYDFVQMIIDKVNEIPEGCESIDWGKFLSVDFMSHLLLNNVIFGSYLMICSLFPTIECFSWNYFLV